MSTRLYVYAILDAPVQVDDLPHVEIVRGPACWLAVTRPNQPQMQTYMPVPSATAETLAAQDAIVRALAMRAEAVLPLRFGTSFDNETALRASLDDIDADRLRAALARVRGGEQMIVRAFRSGDESAPAVATATAAASGGGAGTAYLMQRATALKPAPSRLQPLRELLAPIVREEIAEAAHQARLIESVYHLIARGDADHYRAIVSAWTPTADFVVRVSGPSPAYAFAKDALS